MEKLEKVVKGLKDFATPQKEQQYQPTRPPPPELPGTKAPANEFLYMASVGGKPIGPMEAKHRGMLRCGQVGENTHRGRGGYC